MKKDIKILIAGRYGMVGSACWNLLKESGYQNLIGPSSTELDLTDQKQVQLFVQETRPDAIINAAAKVGGILANSSQPYEFLLNNLNIQNNLIQAAHNENVRKFIFLGSSCIYPKMAKQPITEDSLLSGPLETTNQWYAIAKISGVKLIEALRIQYDRDYIALMPTNLYGPGDNFDLKTSHVMPAMIRKFHLGKTENKDSIRLWGSGNPEREFLHVDDLAMAIKLVLEETADQSLYNVGYGKDISIKELAEIIKDIVGFKGLITWDHSKPDGTPKKLLDSSRIQNLGFRPKIDLKEGIKETYNWFLKNNV